MNFQVKVSDKHGKICILEMTAASQEAARAQATEEGHIVLSIKKPKKIIKLSAGIRSSFSVSVFSQELLALLDAGMTQVEALETINEEDAAPATKRMLKDILNNLYEGRPLSAGLEKYPEIFPTIYIELVRASEKTGNIKDTLRQYIVYRNRLETIRKKLISASFYPVILLVAGFLVCAFLIFYVVPKFSLVYQEMGRDLPFFSMLLMNFGNLVNDNLFAIGTSVIALFALIKYKTREDGIIGPIVRTIGKIPLIGKQLRIHHLALFYRTVSILLRAGISIVPTLTMAEGILRQDLRVRERQARQAISEGKPVSISMKAAELTTPVGYKLLRVGERSGKLDEMTERIADFYDDDVSRWLEWFTKLFEPILMGIIGLVIGLIVVLMYFPIFEIAGNVQ